MPTTSALEPLLTHSEWLAKLARRLVADAADADDLVQDIWVAVQRFWRCSEQKWSKDALSGRYYQWQ